MTHSKPWSASCVVLWQSKGAKSKLTPTCAHRSNFGSQRESDCPRDIDTRRNCAERDSLTVLPPNVFCVRSDLAATRFALFHVSAAEASCCQHARHLSRRPRVNLVSG